MKYTIMLTMLLILLCGSLPLYSASNDHAVVYPDPLRWTDTIKEYQQWDEKNSFPKDAVLFYGSSSIVYWKSAESFPNLPVINRGFGGSYTADALYYVKELALKYKPKVIVIYEGDNDIAGSIPPDWAHRDFVKLTEAIHTALPETEIICLAAKLCQQRWNWRDQVSELNELNKDYTLEKKYLTFVDTAAVLLKADGTPNAEFFQPDRLHLNDNGYKQWNSLLTPIIQERYRVARRKANK